LNGSRNVPVAGDSIVAGYEDLRHHALHNPAASSGLGWAVLVRQGMPVWMKLCAESLTARPKTEASRPAADAVLPCYVRSEMVQILTAMALGCWQEAKA
jgi:hypothetical protein